MRRGEGASKGLTGTHADEHTRRQAHKQKGAGFGPESAIAVPIPLGHERFRHEIARAMDTLSISDTEIDGMSETRACRRLDGRTRPGCPPHEIGPPGWRPACAQDANCPNAAACCRNIAA